MAKEKQVSNEQIASVLEQIAALLEEQDSNPHRVRAYREGAMTIRATERPIRDYVKDEDRMGLMELPGVGEGLANVIFDYVTTGSSDMLESLVNESKKPDARKEKSINKERKADRKADSERPPIATLLEIDAEYRQKAEANELPTISPRRNNPNKEAWLPVLKTKRGPWKFTVLFSNTDKAHQQGRTRDWVVIYFDQGSGEKQVTVVTEYEGAMAGKRVVRGRERESEEFYQAQKQL